MSTSSATNVGNRLSREVMAAVWGTRRLCAVACSTNGAQRSCVQSGTASAYGEAYSPLMQYRQPTGVLAATWIVGAGLIGMAGNVTSVGGVAAVLGCGLVPPLLLVLLTLHASHPLPAAIHQA